MKKNLLEIYALAACFAAMMFLVVNVATCLYEFVRIVAPTVTIGGHEYSRSLSDEEFLRNWPDRRPVPEPATVAQLRREAFEIALRSERHEGLRSFLESLMYAFAAGLAFWLHWRLARRERSKTVAPPA